MNVLFLIKISHAVTVAGRNGAVGAIELPARRKVGLTSKNWRVDMTKQELEKVYDRLSKERDIFDGNRFYIQKKIAEIVDVFNSGIAEESDYNKGIKELLEFLVPLLNKGLRLKIPEIKPEKECKVMIFKGGKD